MIKFVGVLLAGLLFSTSVLAEYPERPIHIIVPFAAGGSLDITARIIAEQLSIELKQPIIVDNKAGASGMIGMDYVAKAKPDGYTLVVAANSLVDVPVVYGNAPYNWKTDFQPISLIQSVPNVIVVRKDSPILSLSDMVHIGKTKPNTLSVADPGVGTNLHMTLELISDYTGSKYTSIHYKGNSPALSDLLAGNVDIQIDQLSSALTNIRAGKTRALAVTSDIPVEKLPGVLPVKLQGIAGLESFSLITYMSLFGPSNLPEHIATKLNSAMVKILKNPDTVKKFDDLGFNARSSTPAEVTAILNREEQEIVPLIKKLNIRAN